MEENEQQRRSGVVPLMTVIETVLSRPSSAGLTQEETAVLTDDLALLAVMQRLAFQSMRQEREQTPRINADFGEVMYGK